jgi:hypothetical protein
VIPAYLWFVRYGRCGAHLKLRIHAPASEALVLRNLLAHAAESYFAAHDAPEPATRSARLDLPPIDPQDQEEDLYPDRTFVWTDYRRSHVSLGGAPFYSDDSYAARFTRCLGTGCEAVLAMFEAHPGDEPPHRARQSTLLDLLVTGLPALLHGADERAAYLAYHRDWLIRFTLLKSNTDPERAGEMIRFFDTRVEATAASALTPLQKVVRADWCQNGVALKSGLWCTALRELLTHIAPLCLNPDYRIDPFAADPIFAPVFKVLHGLANQIGLNMLNEAFTHHLLLRAATIPLAKEAEIVAAVH